MAKKEQLTADQIISDIYKKNFKPIYFLMGDESYFIDQITDAILANSLTEEEKDFNLNVMYGADCDVATVINSSKRYPMMAARQVVVVKEAQLIRNIEDLILYVQKPLMSTILVVNYKNGSLDKRKKLAGEIEKIGVLFESKKLYDNNLPGFIKSYVSKKGFTIEDKAAAMMSDFIGTDLCRMIGELDKLIITIDNKAKRITPELVERNIGVSKDYNNIELLKAIVIRDVYKANLIQKNFEKNPKGNSMIITNAVLFNFFANLMLSYFAKDKSEAGIIKELNLKSVWAVKDYMLAMRSYNAFKCIDIISLIREYDAKLKGINNASATEGELLKELLFKILH